MDSHSPRTMTSQLLPKEMDARTEATTAANKPYWEGGVGEQPPPIAPPWPK
jgi:hypothetical protein